MRLSAAPAGAEHRRLEGPMSSEGGPVAGEHRSTVSWVAVALALALAVAFFSGGTSSDPSGHKTKDTGAFEDARSTVLTATSDQTSAEPEVQQAEPRLGEAAVQTSGPGFKLHDEQVDRLVPQLDEPMTPEQARQRRRGVIINAVGDVNLDPVYIPALATNGYEHALSGLGGLFLEDDLTVINLECPASELGTRVPKQFNFRCDRAALPIIAAMGVDVANQGNNHSLDYGPDALLDSIANLIAAGIAPVGAGKNAAAAAEPAILQRGGWTIAVLGFGGVVPSQNWIATDDSPGMADGDTVASMVAAVAAADELADIVVVTIHWGKELQSGPPPDDVVRAEAMIDAGADMVFGHHAHRLNALEWYAERPIFWGLGNFVWPRLSAAGSDSAVAQVRIEADGSISGCLLDVTIVSGGHPELDDPDVRVCPA